jgi:hypothetical protein
VREGGGGLVGGARAPLVYAAEFAERHYGWVHGGSWRVVGWGVVVVVGWTLESGFWDYSAGRVFPRPLVLLFFSGRLDYAGEVRLGWWRSSSFRRGGWGSLVIVVQGQGTKVTWPGRFWTCEHAICRNAFLCLGGFVSKKSHGAPCDAEHGRKGDANVLCGWIEVSMYRPSLERKI